MTKANTIELKESHDNLCAFIQSMCRDSDVYWEGRRGEIAERQYQRARDLLRAAGKPYRKPRKKF